MPGFTLAEAIVTLAIAAVIMITAMSIYTGVKRAEAAINKRLEGGFAATEILQRITEDIDRLALPGADVTMSVKNKIEAGGYKSAQMIMESKIYDKDNKPQTFEKIVWQSHPNPDANGLIIYRAHSGYTLEDKMLEEPKEKYEREQYIPIISGVTIFSITAGEDSNTNPSSNMNQGIINTNQDSNTSHDSNTSQNSNTNHDIAMNQTWNSKSLPPAVRVSISFAAPQQDVTGNSVVPPEEIKTRTIVVDRFRPIAYQFVYKEFGDANQISDANRTADTNDANMISESNSPGMNKEPKDISGRTNERRRE